MEQVIGGDGAAILPVVALPVAALVDDVECREQLREAPLDLRRSCVALQIPLTFHWRML